MWGSSVPQAPRQLVEEVGVPALAVLVSVDRCVEALDVLHGHVDAIVLFVPPHTHAVEIDSFPAPLAFPDHNCLPLPCGARPCRLAALDDAFPKRGVPQLRQLPRESIQATVRDRTDRTRACSRSDVHIQSRKLSPNPSHERFERGAETGAINEGAPASKGTRPPERTRYPLHG